MTDIIKPNPKYLCTACGTKIQAHKWKEHCETKTHHKQYNKWSKTNPYDKIIFDSHFVTKHALLFTWIPKRKVNLKDYNWKIKAKTNEGE